MTQIVIFDYLQQCGIGYIKEAMACYIKIARVQGNKDCNHDEIDQHGQSTLTSVK